MFVSQYTSDPRNLLSTAQDHRLDQSKGAAERIDLFLGAGIYKLDHHICKPVYVY